MSSVKNRSAQVLIFEEITMDVHHKYQCIDGRCRSYTLVFKFVNFNFALQSVVNHISDLKRNKHPCSLLWYILSPSMNFSFSFSGTDLIKCVIFEE